MYKPIADYAIIGNLRSAALVSTDGCIDWAPAPFIDSASVFAAVLDEKKGGHWCVRPQGSFESSQEYVEHTNILTTTFRTETGMARVIDFIAVEARENHVTEEKAVLSIHRKVECLEGRVSLKVEFNPRFDYARGETKLTVLEEGVLAENGKEREKATLSSPGEYQVKNGQAEAVLDVEAGQTEYLVFSYNCATFSDRRNEVCEQELQRTKHFWEDWVHRCDFETCPIEWPWHENVVRSSLALKILFFEPPGTIAAAPTTSLPEAVGGERNWDYRFTWIRDSVFTLRALFWVGYLTEASEYMRWLLDQCSAVLSANENHIPVMYGLRGQRVLEEQTLDHLEGYKKSAPVRIGNAAYRQHQWDVFGSIFDAVWRLHVYRQESVVTEEEWKVLSRLADKVVEVWREPDEGLWEVRDRRRHFVYSKVMCWVALDRAIKLAEAHGYPGNLETWQKEKEAIRAQVEERGWNEEKQCFTRSYGSDELDASLLLLPVVEFIEGTDPRMVSTIRCVERELCTEEGLLYRYRSSDGLESREGAFVLASFWLVDALVLAGEKEKAQRIFEKLLSLSNHVGLFSEEINPETKEFLGNFPQALTHIGLINSAFFLSYHDPISANGKVLYTKENR